ncbi:MAG: hypothetical protein CVU98_04235 [Firmicutes bacterium HGW-Firmicutes-3]|jgi:type II secretory pathway pseudopilin PulG|nr:MAG: hypothetical protein CVU98_04235 [Firmicutes bacterium HGW-Firmicutes-3]
MYKYFKDEKGSTLVLIMMVMVVLSILGAALLQTSLAENRFAIREENRLKAYYIARAGAEAASSWIEDPAYNLGTITTLITNNASNTTAPTDFADGQFWVSFSGNRYQPTVHSLGEYNGVEQKVNLSLDKNYFFDASVTVTDNLHMHNLNNTNVYGSVALTPSATITGNGQNNIGDLYQTTRNFPSPTNPGLLAASVSWPPPLNEISPSDGYADHSFGTINFGNDTYYINLNGNMELQFDEMIIGSTAEIYVTGTGILNIYTDDIDFKGKLFTDPPAKTVLNVFDNGSFDMQTGNGSFEGFIYGPNADMTISANFDSIGAIIARSLTLQAGGNVSFSSTAGNLYPEELGFPSLGYSRTIWLD